jgi:GNAT superfamily N-acetyltransferase
MPYPPLSRSGCAVLADALGDTPETVQAVHRLRDGRCRAWATGDPAHFSAAIIQTDDLPGEPMGFGDDASALWNLLQGVSGWWCVEVSNPVASVLAGLFAAQCGTPPRLYGDVFHILTTPAAEIPDDAVRLLTLADLTLYESSPEELHSAAFGSLRDLLTQGIVAGAVVDSRLVAMTHTSALTPRYGEIGVYTLPDYRRRGFSTAASALVARAIQAGGRIPVWSCGEDNHASLRVAAKLGFVEVSRRSYVILDAR